MLKKVVGIILVFILLIAGTITVNGAELKTRLDVIKQESETIKLENEQGYITKKIIDSNPETGEVTIQLSLSNTKKEEIVENAIKKTEVIMVIDSSGSMYDYKNEQGIARKTMIVEAAEALGKKLYENVDNIEISAIIFHDNAKELCSLTNNKDEFNNALENWRKSNTRGWTNIDAGITLASEKFNNVTNKIMVVLTDGVPTRDTKGNGSLDVGSEKCKTIAINTREKIEQIREKGIYIIALMTGTETSDLSAEQVIQETALLKEVFGTQTNSTANKYYNISDENINKIVTEDIYKDVVSRVQNPINSIKIVDYFPSEIINNFEFSYVEQPNVGNVSSQIDENTNNIIWEIDKLDGEEMATLKYKLKIKDMKNLSLLNKTIATNDKVVLTYKDTASKDYTATLTSSPQIQLTEIKENVNSNENENRNENKNEIRNEIGNEVINNNQSKQTDNTVANTILPKTGENIVIIGIITILIVSGVFYYIKTKKYNDIK